MVNLNGMALNQQINAETATTHNYVPCHQLHQYCNGKTNIYPEHLQTRLFQKEFLTLRERRSTSLRSRAFWVRSTWELYGMARGTNMNALPVFCRGQPGARFSKVPKTFRARKAICETANRLFWRAYLLTCFQGNKKKNNCEV